MIASDRVEKTFDRHDFFGSRADSFSARFEKRERGAG
jgi:hypothetical protein